MCSTLGLKAAVAGVLAGAALVVVWDGSESSGGEEGDLSLRVDRIGESSCRQRRSARQSAHVVSCSPQA